eukprot:3113513-Heterocapsa_arctica.AAC.1
MAYASAFELFLECGNDRYSKIFDKQMERLNADRTVKGYTILCEINRTTKANIIQSILGLGHVFRQQRHPELADLADIVNYLETELRFYDMRDYMHKTRGQHPQAWNYVQADNEVMTAEVCTS